MLIPNDFYYIEKSGDDYASEAPGSLNVSRLIKGQKAWLQPQALIEQKKKKLFLTDATVNNWGEHKTYEVIAVLNQLVKEGFELYIKQGDGFIALNENNFHLLYEYHMPKVMNADYSENFPKIVTEKLKIPADQIQLLDEYWINIIRDEKVVQACNNGVYPPKRHVIGEDDNLDVEWRNGTVQLIQTTFKPEINTKVADCKHIPVVVELSNIEMQEEIDCESLINQQFHETSYGTITLDQVSKISRLETKNKETIEFIKMINQVHHLRELIYEPEEIEYYNEEEKAQLKELCSKMNLSDLTFLDFGSQEILDNWDNSDTFSQPFLLTLLTHANNLKRLDLENLNDFDALIGRLPTSLEQLSLTMCSLKIDKLDRLLGSCPTIEILNITLSNLKIRDFDHQYQHYSNIKHLIIGTELGANHGENETEEPLIHLIQQCKNLKTLTITGYGIANTSCAESKVGSCPIVTHVYLQNIYANMIDVKRLLYMFPNLTHLSLDARLAESVMLETGQDFKTFLGERYKNIEIEINTGEEKYPSDLLVAEDMEIEHELDLDDIYKDNSMLASSLTIKPTDPNFQFTFSGKNKSINQGMIIDKLSQYITMQGKYTKLLPKLNKGMCAILSEVFHTEPLTSWNAMIRYIKSWDGNAETLNDQLKSIFHTLTAKYIHTYYKGNWQPQNYMGDNLIDWLIQNRVSTTLDNSWHRVAIKYVSDTEWLFYDPNAENGYVKVSPDELKNYINQSLGPIVYISGIKPPLFPAINDKPAFLRNGGLFVLCRAVNYSDIFHHLPRPYQLSVQDFAGLLLRNLEGVPVWTKALFKANEVTSYTLELLSTFTQKYPDEAFDHLMRSISDMTGKDKYELIEKLLQISRDMEFNYEIAGIYHFIDGLVSHIHATYQKESYKTAFTTWNTARHELESVNEFLKRNTQQIGCKHLIECMAAKDIQALVTALQLTSNRPVFYINSPDDLICYGTRILRNGMTGRLNTGYGGAFYNFLSTNNNPANPPLIIINYANFKADEIVKFNTIIDTKREIDRFPIPECATIIGINNINKQDCYKGSDFYSRFDSTERCLFTGSQINNYASLPPLFSDHDDPAVVIDLFHEADWKDRLLGKWILRGDQLHFQEGELISALRKQYPIEIRNGLWEDEEFKLFWNQARIQGYIEHEGMKISIPRQQTIRRSSGYPNELDSYRKKVDEIPDGRVEVLNPSLISQYFVSYHCDSANQLHTLPGIIERNAGKAVAVFISHSISENHWAMLLSECKKFNVKLNFHLPVANEIPLNNIKNEMTCVIQTNDVDASVAMLKNEMVGCIVINISECEASDLLTKLDGRLVNGIMFEFNERERALLKALNEGKNVILKGHFSRKLAESLVPLMTHRLRERNQPSRLICVTDDATGFSFMPVMQQRVIRDDVVKLLGNEVNTLIDRYPRDNFSKLSARLRHLNVVKFNPDPWQGVYHLESTMVNQPVDYNNHRAIADQFDRNRYDLLENVLRYNRYALVTGLTGVGKTTSIEKFYHSNQNQTLYLGKDNIEVWARDNSPKRKVLFLDEANMSGTDWTQFDGTGVLINGEYIELTDQHRVIFACNPVSYGGERKLPELFAQHGNAIVFETMPKEYIYTNILLPVFINSKLGGYARDISDIILNYYQFLCERSTDEVLISPRELQMIALLVIAHRNNHPNCNVKEITNHYSQQITASLVPSKYIEEFNDQFKTHRTYNFTGQVPVHDPRFIITPSREPIAQHLSDLLSLREQRRTEQQMNDTQRYGGLGGIILEGDPGVGKSELVFNILLARGYREGSLTQESIDEKVFYKIPVNLQPNEKRNLLLKAFHEGAVVIMDEINSSPMLESLLNDLLMGKGPGGQRPARPGFTLIGTQNPMTQEGRIKLSSATTHRLSVVQVAQYDTEEIEDILMHHGLTKREAENISAAFISQVNLAKRNGYNPAPTFRNLLRLADKIILSRQSEFGNISAMIDRKYPDFVLVSQLIEEYLQKLPEQRTQLLMSLFKNYDRDIVKKLLLLTDDININAVDYLGWTPLHYAVNSGDVELVNAVLKHRPDVNISATGYYSCTPLQIAIDEEYHDIVSVLMKVPGIKVDSQIKLTHSKLSFFEEGKSRETKKSGIHVEDDINTNESKKAKNHREKDDDFDIDMKL